MQTFEEAYRELDVCNEGIKPSFEKMWNTAQAAMRAPSPCGKKFADGTPHPRATQKCKHTFGKTCGPECCLICDSEAKLRAEYNIKLDSELLDLRLRIRHSERQLTALREGLQHKADLFREVASTYPAGSVDADYFNFKASDFEALLTPPAASGRCKACSAETVTADESGLCAPCRIVRDGLRASGRESEEGQKS